MTTPSAHLSQNNFFRSTNGFSSNAGGSQYGGSQIPPDKTYVTSNQVFYQDYKIKHNERPQTCKPKYEVVRTGGFPAHFKSYQQKEYVQRKYKHPAVDMIPFP